ncbi:hypothetical protein B0H14DRAFT_2557006 [Mycena olivaceomarginata]|nr:hypothetical protein B0H14DRAFT_2557006 [Mycena olivaceomarginata]
MACKPFGRAWAGDASQNPRPRPKQAIWRGHKPFGQAKNVTLVFVDTFAWWTLNPIFSVQVDVRKHDLSAKPHKPAGLHVGYELPSYLRGSYSNPAEWLAKPTFWLASRNAGLGLVITAKSKPKPETSHSAQAQATLQAKKLTLQNTPMFGGNTAASICRVRITHRRLPKKSPLRAQFNPDLAAYARLSLGIVFGGPPSKEFAAESSF